MKCWWKKIRCRFECPVDVQHINGAQKLQVGFTRKRYNVFSESLTSKICSFELVSPVQHLMLHEYLNICWES
jgi:hypothetical protein